MKIKKSYLSFYKEILEKVKFDKQLFWKEYQKALKLLSDKERIDLNHWIYQRYRSNVN